MSLLQADETTATAALGISRQMRLRQNYACMLACADNIAVAEGNTTKIEATVDTEGKEDYSTQEVIEAMIGKDLAHVNFNVKTATK